MSEQPCRPPWMSNDPTWFKGAGVDTQANSKAVIFCKILKELSSAVEQTIKAITVWNEFWSIANRRR